MKAIVLWQPWASAMALGLKRNETRHWLTHYRGQLAICAAKRIMGELEWSIVRAHFAFCDSPEPVPYGAVLCVVDLFDCVPTESFRVIHALTSREAALGDYTPGRFAWLTRNVRRLPNPVPVTGRQGLFNLPPEVEAAVRKQLL